MPHEIRRATLEDAPAMAMLLAHGARGRAARDPGLWALMGDSTAQIEMALRAGLETPETPIRQRWLVAVDGGRLLGTAQVLHLPVPPIYAGRFGPPGLWQPVAKLADGAPVALRAEMLAAGEDLLRREGAQILLAAHLPGDDWEGVIRAAGYTALTLYLARSGLRAREETGPTRPATESDLAAIVALSAGHRRTLEALEPFWEAHPEADNRFGAWMARSLTLGDRDMRVVEGTDGGVSGYIIAQPATRLHIAAGHEIANTGVIDDFHHRDLQDISTGDSASATALLRAAEQDFTGRGTDTALVVCPADWRVKVAMLEATGYATALVWGIKRPG